MTMQVCQDQLRHLMNVLRSDLAIMHAGVCRSSPGAPMIDDQRAPGRGGHLLTHLVAGIVAWRALAPGFASI